MQTAKLVITYRATVRGIYNLLDTICISVAGNNLYCRKISMMPPRISSLHYPVCAMCNTCSVTRTLNVGKICDDFVALSLIRFCYMTKKVG